MKYGTTLIPGDGIGTEVSDAAVRIVGACGLDIEWDRVDAGAGALADHGTTLPESVRASIRERRVALKGPLTTPVGKGFVSVNVTLRKALELYVSLRPRGSPWWTLPTLNPILGGMGEDLRDHICRPSSSIQEPPT